MEVRATCSAVLFCLVGLLTAGTSGQLEPNCPVYVSELDMLRCTCTYRSPYPPSDTAHLSWPDHSATATLTIASVVRADNGTTFVCQMVMGAVTNTTVYTLQVAYGPSDDDLSITGPRPILADGITPVTLTCLATKVNPEPSYSWSGVACSNGNQGNACTFTPALPGDENRVVTCSASNPYVQPAGQIAQKNFSLDINYPPSSKPAITGYTDGRPLSTGDNLVCTVKGGNPLVAMVLFRCLDPQLPDEEDFRNATSVSSPLTVDTTRATSGHVTCLCSAFWTVAPSLYGDSLNSIVVNFTIEYTPGETTTTATATTTTARSTTTTATATTTTATSTTTTATSTTTPVTQTTTAARTTTATQSTSPPEPTTTTTTTTTSAGVTETSTQPAATTSSPAVTTASSAKPSESSSSTERQSSTSGSGSATTADVTSAPSDVVEFPVAAFAGGLAGAVLVIIIIIVIVVLCRRKRARDVRLVNNVHLSDGSYTHTTNKDFYVFENSGYDKAGMREIEAVKPTNGVPPPYASHDRAPALQTYTQEASVSFHDDDDDEDNNDDDRHGKPANASGDDVPANWIEPQGNEMASSTPPSSTSPPPPPPWEPEREAGPQGETYAVVVGRRRPLDDDDDDDDNHNPAADTTTTTADTESISCTIRLDDADDEEPSLPPPPPPLESFSRVPDVAESPNNYTLSSFGRSSAEPGSRPPLDGRTTGGEQTASMTFGSDDEHAEMERGARIGF